MKHRITLFATLLMLACSQAGASDQVNLIDQQATISSAAADRLLSYTKQQAINRGYHICIAIDDAAGNLLAFDRMQGANAGCVEAALAKAHSAGLNAVNTQIFYDLARKQNLALGFIPGILPAMAGVVLHDHASTAVGSIGIAGGPSDDAEQSFALQLSAQFQQWLTAPSGHE
jgi:glc operon protein GlcG